MDETSLSLLGRASQPNADSSWNQLAEVYSPLLRRWLRSYDVQPADADDLIQEVLTVVSQELPAFDHNQRTGAFRNWLRKILVNRLRGYWRDRRMGPTVSGGSSALERINQLEDANSEISRIWNDEHDREVVSRLMAIMQPKFLPKTWEAFHRQMFQGQRADQVAEELEMPLGSVYVARCRVLAALRREAAGLIDLE
ncbi:MAG: sigma-70 family RNA polymerase sigma factor [Pirellulaceae bacterium]